MAHKDSQIDDDSKTLLHFYLENKDSMPVSEEQITKMSCKPACYGEPSHVDGMEPQTFSQISQ
jgi:hypothetical protein